MRIDCRHYESRTYGSGEVVRKCRLDLAPDAPWRCPADCSGYERRTVDVGWHYGSLADTVAAEPVPVPDGDDVAALLDAAEEIVTRASMEVAEEEAARRARGRFKRAKKKKKKR